ncbi:MAG: Asp23/Gls24 family envelope stress response protein [Limnochordaceae bacterium]|nr:Asp23/Gls24 family envelope stress response protein [Limnochordaceae bacterium]
MPAFRLGETGGAAVEEIQERLGRVEIANEVIAQVAGAAAVGSYGLIGMAARNVQEGIGELLGWGQLGRGVEVHDSPNGIVVDLHIVVEYGVKISEVAHNVMQQVRYQLEELLGITVAKVNVHVEGVRVSAPPAANGRDVR